MYLQKAVDIEADMVYAEPRDWMLNPKQYLGAALLAAGKWSEAQKTFEKDLKVNAENVWSLHGRQDNILIYVLLIQKLLICTFAKEQHS